MYHTIGAFSLKRENIDFNRPLHKNSHTEKVWLFYGYRGKLKCLGQMNCPCAKVFAFGKTLVRRKSAAPTCGARSCPVSMPYGEDKKKHQPIGWCFFFVSKWIVRVLTGQALRLASLFSRLLPGVLVDDPLNELNRSINAIGGRVDT